MSRIDLTPLYRSSVGFDRLGSLLDTALGSEQTATGWPPYDIEVLDDNHYGITLAVAGFSHDELDIKVEQGVLTVSGKKAQDKQPHKYLYQGIANRSFERKYNLADYVEVIDAELNNGLLRIQLKRELPEAMKPRAIPINTSDHTIEHKKHEGQAA